LIILIIYFAVKKNKQEAKSTPRQKKRLCKIYRKANGRHMNIHLTKTKKKKR